MGLLQKCRWTDSSREDDGLDEVLQLVGVADKPDGCDPFTFDLEGGGEVDGAVDTDDEARVAVDRRRDDLGPSVGSSGQVGEEPHDPIGTDDRSAGGPSLGTAVGDKDGRWTTVVAAAILLP